MMDYMNNSETLLKDAIPESEEQPSPGPVQRKSRTQRRLERENNSLRRYLCTMCVIVVILLICVLIAGYEVSQMANIILSL